LDWSDVSAGRFAIPNSGLSVLLASLWLPRRPADASDLPEGLGVYLLHVPTGIHLNVRQMEFEPVVLEAGLEQLFASYADISWPGARRTVTTWTAGVLNGVSGVFEGAMPESIVREWMLTDGMSMANAATFATAQQWQGLLPDCDALVRTIRFQ
jgi:hypothetical protein